ncbi:ABC transporter permease subunit [Acholeplasma vituli]|uniref:ABC transporter permease subunit n=1 Tax=Paracholeplasma vituli TaxID=69473 RepID=A0ABT2PVD9_9MOLU|nr:ABC transporter permease subunit [Paracholeplasma vituli]MCU0104916.1 ABC transporter permease subunit [Paracholeplasma vituli]
MFSNQDIENYLSALKETLFLTFGTGAFVLILGLIIGFLLYILENDAFVKPSLQRSLFYRILSVTNDVARSIPFILLLIMMIPVTRAIMGTMLGAEGALPALIVSASPFFARVVHNALKNVSNETIEALLSMGASKPTLVRIIFKEAFPQLVSGFTLTLVTLVGFMSAAAVIGAGGLAFLAYENGKFGNNYPLMYVAIFSLLLLVLVIQLVGDALSKLVNHN